MGSSRRRPGGTVPMRRRCTGHRTRSLARPVAAILATAGSVVVGKGIVGSLAPVAGAATTPPAAVFALDEVAGIAPLPSLPALAAEGGGQGLVTLACLQDLSQARSRWGQAAEGFFSLFNTKLLFPGVADHRTLQLVSALAGEVPVPENGRLRVRRRAARVQHKRDAVRRVARHLQLVLLWRGE